LNLDYFKDGNPWFNVNLIFKSIGPNSIKLQDYHGDIIQLSAHHTQAFEQGFIDGYCSTQVKGSHSDSDADWGTFDCDYDATQFKGSNESAPYDVGFLAGKKDSKTNTYDSTSACNDYNTINNTAAQAFECLKGYADGDISPYHSGYIQGIQGITLKGIHTQQYLKGYFKGLQGYYWNRGLVEGYSGLPMSLQKNKNYTDAYKSEHAERAAGYPCTKKAGFDLGILPAHTNDNYRDFYLGLDRAEMHMR